MKLSSNVLYGGVAGTVQASALLAALPASGRAADPLYDGMWIVVTAVVVAITRSYALHVSTHQDGPGRFWPDLGAAMWLGWPIVVSSLPTLALLLVADFTHWPDDRYAPNGTYLQAGWTTYGLVFNVVLLFVWGIVSARSGGYSARWTVLVGFSNATLGLLIVGLNVLIK